MDSWGRKNTGTNEKILLYRSGERKRKQTKYYKESVCWGWGGGGRGSQL